MVTRRSRNQDTCNAVPSSDTTGRNVCVILVEALRRTTGAGWHLLSSDASDSSCRGIPIEVREHASSPSVLIQPLESIPEWKMWHTLSQNRTIRRDAWAEAAGDSVRARINNVLCGLTPDAPTRMILAFNTAPLDDAVLPYVAKAFKARHESWVRGTGFRGIWLVGSAPDHCRRLDHD